MFKVEFSKFLEFPLGKTLKIHNCYKKIKLFYRNDLSGAFRINTTYTFSLVLYELKQMKIKTRK